MRRFGRRPSEEPRSAIDRFWDWWPTARYRITDAVERDRLSDVAGEISAQVAALDPALEWDVAPGDGATLALALAAGGNLARRTLTQRWWLSAPVADEAWEFHPARQRSEVRTIELGIIRLDAARFRVGLRPDEHRERVDVDLFHPTFPSLAEDRKRRSIRLFLERLLGEDDVARWVGAVREVQREPSEALDPAGFRDAVDALRARATGERFALMQGRDARGRPQIVNANLAVKRIDHLFADQHGEVRIQIRDPNPSGFPREVEAEALDRMEDDLIAAIGGSALYIGRVTVAGERVLHLVAPAARRATAVIDAWSARHRGRRIASRWREDPEWTFLAGWAR